MPFPKLKHVSPARFFEPVISHCEVTDNGTVIEVIDRTKGTMPPVEDYDLDKLIKAGVPLKKVSTKILKSGISDLSRVVDDIEKSAHVEPAPVEPAPVEPAPVESAPVEPKS